MLQQIMTPFRHLFLALALALFGTSAAFAQAMQDIRPHLRTLNAAQKQNVLAFMRSKAPTKDTDIQNIYETSTPEIRAATLYYIEYLKKPANPNARTTTTWNRDTVFFGKKKEGFIVMDSFKVTNTGTEPYLISNVRTACDCAVFKYPKFPVFPGETATIRAEFNTTGKAGLATTGVIIYDNSTPNQRQILYFSGEITPKIKPKSLLEEDAEGTFLHGKN